MLLKEMINLFVSPTSAWNNLKKKEYSVLEV